MTVLLVHNYDAKNDSDFFKKTKQAMMLSFAAQLHDI